MGRVHSYPAVDCVESSESREKSPTFAAPPPSWFFGVGRDYSGNPARPAEVGSIGYLLGRAEWDFAPCAAGPPFSRLIRRGAIFADICRRYAEIERNPQVTGEPRPIAQDHRGILRNPGRSRIRYAVAPAD